MGLETNDGVADRLTVTLAEVGPLSFYCGESDKLAADSISASELAPLHHCSTACPIFPPLIHLINYNLVRKGVKHVFTESVQITDF